MQRLSTRLLRSALILMSLGLACIWGLSDDPEQQAAQTAYQRADCQRAIPALKYLTQRSPQPAPATTADWLQTTGATGTTSPPPTKNHYRLAECQRYQSARQAQQSQQFNSAFAQYVRFAKIYPHSALVSFVRTQLQRIADRTSPGRLASIETCQGLTMLLDRGVLSNDHSAVPHLLLTCGRLWSQEQEFDRAVHAYAALEIRYPNHYLVQMFAPEFQRLLQRSSLNRSSVADVYQAVEQRDLNRLNQLAQPEPHSDWLTEAMWPIVALNRWLGGYLGAYLFIAGLSLLFGWSFLQSFGVRYLCSIRPALSPRPRGDRPARPKPAGDGQPRGLNLANGQYRLGQRSLRHPSAQAIDPQPPTPSQTTQHLSSIHPSDLHPTPGAYRLKREDLDRRGANPSPRSAPSTPPPKSPPPPSNAPKAKAPKPSTHRRSRPKKALEKQLLLMVQQNRPTAERLVDWERSRVPNQSEDWYWQAAIDRLLRDRR